MWLADDSLSAQYGPSWPRHHLGWFFQYGKIITLAAHIRISGRKHLKRIILEQPGMQINNRARHLIVRFSVTSPVCSRIWLPSEFLSRPSPPGEGKKIGDRWPRKGSAQILCENLRLAIIGTGVRRLPAPPHLTVELIQEVMS